MKSIEYPSADFPGPPRIRLEVPEGWEPLTVPGVQLAVAQPRIEGRFRANVVVTVQRFGPEFTLEAARAGLEQRKASLPELEELGTGEIELEGRTWIASEYGYTQPGRPTVCRPRYAVLTGGGRHRCARDRGQLRRGDADEEIETVRDAGLPARAPGLTRSPRHRTSAPALRVGVFAVHVRRAGELPPRRRGEDDSVHNARGTADGV